MSAISPFTAMPPDAPIPEARLKAAGAEAVKKPSRTDSDIAEIKQLSEEFESLFLGIVLKSMRDTIPKDGMINGGNAEDIYRSMLDTEYAKDMARQRSTGLADNIESYLMQAYTAQLPPATQQQAELTGPPAPTPVANPARATVISAYERATRLK